MKKITLISLMLLVPFVATAGKVEPPRGKVLTEHATPLGSPRSGLNPLGDPDTVAPMSAGTWNAVSFGTSGACSSPFTGFPVTFNDTTGSCTSESSAITLTSGTVDCDYTTTVIEGTESALINNASIFFNFGKTITSRVRVAWYYRPIVLGGNNIRFSFAASGIGRDPRVYAPWAGSFFRIYDFTEGILSDVSTTTVAINTTYKMCIDHDPTDDTTTLYIDAGDGDWCAGAGDTLTLDGASAIADINQFILQGLASEQNIVDEVTACDAP
jgi:hypothetical protein